MALVPRDLMWDKWDTTQPQPPPGPSGPTSSAGVTLTGTELQKLVQDAVEAARTVMRAGLPPPSLEQAYRNALGSSEGKREGEHEWKRPDRALEAVEFPELCWARSELETECGREMVDVVTDSFATKRPRSPSSPAPAKRPTLDSSPGGDAPPLTQGRRDDLALAAAGFRTVLEEQLQQALNSTLDPTAIPKPVGTGALRPVIPKHAGGNLAGLDLQVYPAVSLDAQERKLVLGEDGRVAWTASNTESRCSTLPEWERRFLHHDAEGAMVKFYDYLFLRMEGDESVTFNITCYTEIFADYARESGLRPNRGKCRWSGGWGNSPKGGKGKGGKPSNLRRQTDQPAAPRDTSADGGAGGAQGGRGCPRRERPHIRDACAQHQTNTCTYGQACRGAPEGAGGERAGVPAADGVDGPEEEDDEEDVMSMAGALEFEAVECEEGGTSEGAPDMTWWEHLNPTAFVPMRQLLARVIREHMEAAGTMEHERATFVREVQEVPNYVGDEHMEAMGVEIEKETQERRIFPAVDRLPWDISALGMVEKVRNSKVKYRPMWDYSRPVDTHVNARIDLENDKFSTVKDAYASLRPGKWMVKAQGVPCVGYLDDDFMVADTWEDAEEYMMLLVEMMSFLGFKVNSAKCEGPARKMEFLWVLLSTGGARYTTAISRSFNQLVASASRAKIKVTAPVLEDLDTIKEVIRKYNGRAVVLYREDVKEDFWATDSSGKKGMGGVIDKDTPPHRCFSLMSSAHETQTKARALSSLNLHKHTFLNRIMRAYPKCSSQQPPMGDMKQGNYIDRLSPEIISAMWSSPTFVPYWGQKTMIRLQEAQVFGATQQSAKEVSAVDHSAMNGNDPFS
ncbi:hypothetical protein CYMTET_38020 [Cymbomonas tetramitiformis]|uniref:Uncharacterized protein n=1 Tax=Cymbomonas tetramitiformis TaxID=36881 RepID=A0AAE0CEK4_9CHLO|nr:hypothetical protein CYMTET_38020 [Cymbomonas tetramitiformis]